MSEIPFSQLSPSILDEESRLRVARQILAVLEDHLKSSGLRGRRVLDLGCSSGIITKFLADVSDSIVGIDVDTEALARTRTEPKKLNARFLVMSGSDLAFRSGTFDVVICNQVYYWFDDPERLFAEVHRVLKPGGCCFLASVNKYTLWEPQYRLPFLAFLPRPVADFSVRAAGKGSRFGCHYLSFWGLGRLSRRFIVHRYTARVIKDPERYNFKRLSTLRTLTKALPIRLCEVLEPLSPNFVWVLEKPRSVSP